MKCGFCKHEFEELFTHWRRTDTGWRVFGICENCLNERGSHTNSKGINYYTYTEKYKEEHPKCEL